MYVGKKREHPYAGTLTKHAKAKTQSLLPYLCSVLHLRWALWTTSCFTQNWVSSVRYRWINHQEKIISKLAVLILPKLASVVWYDFNGQVLVSFCSCTSFSHSVQSVPCAQQVNEQLGRHPSLQCSVCLLCASRTSVSTAFHSDWGNIQQFWHRKRSYRECSDCLFFFCFSISVGASCILLLL